MEDIELEKLMLKENAKMHARMCFLWLFAISAVLTIASVVTYSFWSGNFSDYKILALLSSGLATIAPILIWARQSIKETQEISSLLGNLKSNGDINLVVKDLFKKISE